MSAPVSRKICLLGDFGVGKTSLVARFVRQQFSEKYLTTVGVKIDTKEVAVAGTRLKLVIWDLSGTAEPQRLPSAYLRGAGGYLLVADGTRADTLDSALLLHRHVTGLLGPLPWVGLLNKRDLADEWEIAGEPGVDPAAGGSGWLHTSARTGANVEKAFLLLAERMVAP